MMPSRLTRSSLTRSRPSLTRSRPSLRSKMMPSVLRRRRRSSTRRSSPSGTRRHSRRRSVIDRHSNHRSANRLTPCSLLALPGEEKAAAARERREEETDEEAAEPMQAEANETVAFEADETGEAEASSMGYEAVMPHEEVRVVVFICCTRIHRTPPMLCRTPERVTNAVRRPRRSLWPRARRARRRGAPRCTLLPPRAPLRLRRQRCSTPSSARRSRSRWDRASRPASLSPWTRMPRRRRPQRTRRRRAARRYPRSLRLADLRQIWYSHLRALPWTAAKPERRGQRRG